MVGLPEPHFLEINYPSYCTCVVGFWSLAYDVSSQMALPVSLQSDGVDWVTQKVLALAACHLFLADKCPLLQKAFPDPPLSPACFRMAPWAPLESCCLSAWPPLCLQSKVLTAPDTKGPGSWFWTGCIKGGTDYTLQEILATLHPPCFCPAQTEQELYSVWAPQEAQEDEAQSGENWPGQ